MLKGLGGSAPGTSSSPETNHRDPNRQLRTGKEGHYDGAKDGKVALLMVGEGPETAVPVSTPPPAH